MGKGKGKKGGNTRIRLYFDDHILRNNSQLSDGLGRCWILLNPSIASFADLASHLCEKFALRNCLVFSIDDFVLPSFESTHILKDKDIIRVKLKDVKMKDVCQPCNGQNTLQNPQFSRARGLQFNNNTMSDEKSQENLQEIGNNDNDDHDGNSSLDIGVLEQKRKHSLELHHPRRKKLKSNCTEKQATGLGIQDIHSMQNIPFGHVNDGFKTELHISNITGNDGLVFTPPIAYLGKPSNFMPCKERQQSDGINIGHEFEPESAFDVTKEYVLSSAITIQKCQSQFTATEGSYSFSDNHKNKSSGLCMESGTHLNRRFEAGSFGIKSKTEHIIDFARLFPLTRPPQKGDILAYQYVEPSSTVYPVLSHPQVGEVSVYDYKSSEIVLILAPEFEVFSEYYSKTSYSLLQKVPPYKEDGSLEIEFSKLIDVRLLKAHDSKELACLPEELYNRFKKDKWEIASAESSWNYSNSLNTDKKASWDSWIPNNNNNTLWPPSTESNIFSNGRKNGSAAPNERRTFRPWMIYGTSPAEALFWEMVLSKVPFGKGGKFSSSGKC